VKIHTFNTIIRLDKNIGMRQVCIKKKSDKIINEYKTMFRKGGRSKSALSGGQVRLISTTLTYKTVLWVSQL
jgi:hypothetical protein